MHQERAPAWLGQVSTRSVRYGRSGLALLAVLGLTARTAAAQWPQWGGPQRDFQSAAGELADAWPEAGPKLLWERALGPGYSSLVVEGERVFTLYESGEEEVVVALDAATGATVWEHRYATEEGNAPPNSTPVLAGERIYTLGFFGQLTALERASGKLVWSHDLVKEYGSQAPMFGFAASPLVHGDTLIVPAGGKGYGVAAFALADGKLLWHGQDFVEIYASPLLIEVGGETQVVVLAQEELAGLDPATGKKLWSETVINGGGQNITTPLWSADGMLLVTTGTEGSLALRLTQAEGKTRVERAWKSPHNVFQTTVVRAGAHLLGSTYIAEKDVVAAFDPKDGSLAWQLPGFSAANVLVADGKLVLLDYEGRLALASAGPEGPRVHSQAKVLGSQVFTPPSLVGTRLFARDPAVLKAFELGATK